MIDPRLALRFKKAWSALRPEQQARILPHIEEAHQKLHTFLSLGTTPVRVERRELLFARTVLDNKGDIALSSASAAMHQASTSGRNVHVDGSGDILGFGRYQLLDPGWLEAAVVWLEYLGSGQRFDFGRTLPTRITIPNSLTIALLGDFGTGDWGSHLNPAPSTRVRKAVSARNPEITVHLGDAYYAGTTSSELGNFVALWPFGSTASFALNSNHEMYPGGIPYFSEALGYAGFSAQRNRSFFALENDAWVLVGLDTAFFSDPYGLYMDGAIDDLQVRFLSSCAGTGKQLVILSHHNGLTVDGAAKTSLWDAVLNACGGNKPKLWYWGHEHAGAVYTDEAGSGVRCRCTGHSALPWGFASDLKNARVAWFESRNAADPDDPVRVLNGFSTLKLQGESCAESFIDENNDLAWSG